MTTLAEQLATLCADHEVEVRNRWTNRVQFTAEITCAPDATVGLKLGLAVRWGYSRGADLSGTDLSGAILSGTDLSGADLSGTDLSGAILSGTDLSGAILSGTDLSGAVLSGTDLSGAILSGTDLSGAILSGTDLSGAVLRGTVLRDVDLRDADLRDADLRDVDLRGADLRGTVLRAFKADMWMTLTQARAEVPMLVAALREGRVNGSQYEGRCACLVGTLANAADQNYTTMFPDASSRHPAEQWFLMIREGDKPADDSAGGFASAKALEWALEYCALTGLDLGDVPPIEVAS